VRGLDRAFDYVLPARLQQGARPGTIVRVPLQGRRVRGWVLGSGGGEAHEATLREVIEIVSAGPPPQVVELASFAAWRYAGRRRPFLLAGSPSRIVALAPARALSPALAMAPDEHRRHVSPELEALVAEGLAGNEAIVRLPPAASRLGVVEAVLRRARGRGTVLVIVPGQHDAQRLADALSTAGWGVALLPEGWSAAAGGALVAVGTRDAVFAPVETLRAIVVLDAHAEALVETRAPTWRADVIAAERARRAKVPCLLVSACPTPEQADRAPVLTLSREEERAGWAPLVVLDRRRDDPRTGRYAEALSGLIRSSHAEDPRRPVVCVLNRRGRARLFACGSCGEIARCSSCGAAVGEAGEAETMLACQVCSATRPRFCIACGSSRLKTLRVGTARAAEELAALTGLEVAEVSGPRRRNEAVPSAPVLVGTEAVLYRARSASLVVFLDLDQELLAPRLNAPVHALSLLALASRLVGGRRRRCPGPGRVVVQTRLLDHEVVQAALHADPSILLAVELDRRRALGLPPERAVALVSGEGVEAVRNALCANVPELETALEGERLLVRAREATSLADGLARLGPLAERVRIEVDPLGL
jgi:primosomal protein N' (replication factor Y)